MNCDLAQIWSKCPPFTKFLVILGLISSIIQLFYQIIFLELANITYQTTFKFQIWRIITSWIVYFNILDYIVSGICLLLLLYVQQMVYSTVLMAIDFIIQTTILQLIYSILSMILFFTGIKKNFITCGTFTMVMIYFTRRCMANPQGASGHLCCPSARNKFIPLIVAIIITLLSLNFDILLAYILGVIQSTYFNGSFISLSAEKVSYVQHSCIILYLFQSSQSFVKNCGQGIGLKSTGIKRQYNQSSNIDKGLLSKQDQGNKFLPFRGKPLTMQ